MNENYITYNKKFPGEEGSLAIKIRYEVKTEEGKKTELTAEQIKIISNALSNQVNLDVKKTHSMNITVIGKDKFTVLLDNKFSIFISKTESDDSVAAPEKIAIIVDKIKNKTLFSNFKEFFRSIYYLFYPPAYPSIAIKDRPYRAVVQQDFRALRKGLEQGKNWLSSAIETKITSKQHKERTTLTKQVESSISYAKKIEAALSKKDQTKALSNLAHEISNKLFDPNDTEMKDSIVIPAGYVNAENTLQPVMFRFYRNEKNHLCVEIYSDVAEGISKFPPAIAREFTQNEYTKETLKNMLDAIFAPLIEKKVDQKKLMKAIQPSSMFTELYAAKTEKKEKSTAKPKAALVSEGKITYELLLTSIDEIIGKITEDVSPKNQKLVNNVQSPAERVTKWFDHLAGGAISKNEKINLLYTITEQWVNDQLRQISKETSLEMEKEVNQAVLATISRVKEKISLAIHEGVPIGPEFGFPGSLLTIEKQAQETIEKLAQKIRKGKIELSSGQLQKKQKSVVGVPIQLKRELSVSQKREEINIETIGNLNRQWDEVSKKISHLFSQETLETIQKKAIIEKLLEIGYKDDTFIKKLALSGEINPEELSQIVKVLIPKEVAETIIQELKREDPYLQFSPEEFMDFLKQITLTPHLVPMLASRDPEGKGIENRLYQFIRKVEDPNSYFPPNVLPAIEKMRAFLTLPLLINKENKCKDLKPIEAISKGITSLSGIGDQNVGKIDRREISNDLTKYRNEVVETLGHAVQLVNDFYQSAETQSNHEEKKIILEEARRRMFDIVKSLPVPGSEGAEGIPSLWYLFGYGQTDPNFFKYDGNIDILFTQLQKMEHLLWESQLRLAKTEISGKEQFFQIKIQAIRQALIRGKVCYMQRELDKVMQDYYKKKKDYRGRENIPFWDVSPADEITDYVRILKEYNRHDILRDFGYFRLGKHTLDTMAINEVLTQDLTSTLSSEPDLHRQLLSLYHFALRDRNAGMYEGVISPHQPIEQQRRIPLFSEHPVGDQKNHNSFYSKETVLRRFPPNDYQKRDYYSYYESVHPLLDSLSNSHFYAQTAKDPNFTIHSLSPTLGVSFFDAQPETLLAQPHLDIEHVQVLKSAETITHRGETYITPYSEQYDHYYYIVNDKRERLAEICTGGHPKYCALELDEQQKLTGQDQELLIQPKQNCNPIVKNDQNQPPVSHPKIDTAELFDVWHPKDENPPPISDSRIYAPFDVWNQYVTEITQRQEQAIPPAVLNQLFQIRQAPDRLNGYAVTSYSPITSLNALEFITLAENQKYMKLDFVQNFLYESLFGPFVLQQAIVYYPEEIQKQSEQLISRLSEAAERGDHELVAFYTDLIHRISEQISLTQETLLSQGLLSGVVNGSLPSDIGANYGAGLLFHSILEAVHHQEGGTLGVVPVAIGKKPLHLPSTNMTQPLIELMNKIGSDADRIQEVVKKGDVYFSEMFFTSEIGPMEGIKNPQLKKNLSIYLLEGYRRRKKEKELQPKELQEIFLAYHRLLDETIETTLTQKKNDLIDWVRGEIFPLFSQNEQMRNQYLQTFLELQKPDQPIEVLSSTPIHNTLGSYHVKLRGLRGIDVNLYTMTVAGKEEAKPKREVYLPDEVIRNRSFSQAIQQTRVKAGYTKKSDGADRYVWEEDGQTFKVTKKGNEQIHIQRTIKEGPYQGTYIFYPFLEAAANNSSLSLLEENGIWQKEGEPLPKYIFSGSAQPTTKNVFKASFDEQAGKTLFKEITNGEGKLVASIDFSTPSAVLFASSQNIMTLLDPETKIPSEIQVKNSSLSLKKEEGGWVAYLGGDKQGKVTYPEDEKKMIENFGEHWDRYVIPIQIEKTENRLIKGTFERISVVEMQYLVIPYPQTVDATGKVSVEQDFPTVKNPMIFKMDKDGTIKGPLAGELYLAHAQVAQSAKTKNTTAARTLLLQAESHLSNIQNERPSSDPEEIKQLQTIFSYISQHQAVELTKQTHPETIAQNIKLLLNIRKVRKLLEAQLGNNPLLTPKDNYQEKHYLAKLYEAYLMYEKEKIHGMFDKTKIHKTSFALQEGEKKELDRIADTLLQDIKRCIEGEGAPGFESFFGITQRFVGALSIDSPEEVNPDFLLSLVRLAKPVDTTISLKKEKGPIPLDKLLENFWSYFISIKRENLNPQDLLILFQQSFLPPPQISRRTRTIDSHRQASKTIFAKICETSRTICR